MPGARRDRCNQLGSWITDTLSGFVDLAIDAFTYANENRRRVARLAAGYGLWGWGIARILHPRSEGTEGQMDELATGALALAFGVLAHPGSLGDENVRTDEQHSLAHGLWRESGFSHPYHATALSGENSAWTLGRAFVGLLVGVQFPYYASAPFFNAMAGMTLLPYLADRSWSYVRAYRHHRGAPWRFRIRAFLLNQVTGNTLDTVGTLMQSALAFNLRNLQAHSLGLSRTTWDGDAAMQGLAAMYAGTLLNALYTFLLAHTPYRHNLALRQVGHGLRLVARARVRRHYNDDRNAEGENVWYVYVVVDILFSIPMHRWCVPGLTAAKAVSGLERGGHSTFDLHKANDVVPAPFPHLSPQSHWSPHSPHSPLSPRSAASSREPSASALVTPARALAWGEGLGPDPARSAGSVAVSVRFETPDDDPEDRPSLSFPRDSKGPRAGFGSSRGRQSRTRTPHPVPGYAVRRALPAPAQRPLRPFAAPPVQFLPWPGPGNPDDKDAKD